MTIGRSLSGGFWSVFVGGGCRLSVAHMLSAIYMYIECRTKAH